MDQEDYKLQGFFGGEKNQTNNQKKKPHPNQNPTILGFEWIMVGLNKERKK